MTTMSSALAGARRELNAARVETATLDARLLLADAAGLDMARLIAAGDDPLPEIAERRFRTHIKRRISREPVSRILGEREFWGMTLEVGPATLVPRPETETLVEAVLAEAERFPADLRICDLGTGTGAILIALLSELPKATGVAVDISEAALSVARRNAGRHGLGDRATFVCADYARAPIGASDIVVSNPPYVRSHDIAALEPEVRDHDPRLALDGGPDGLDAYRAIAAQAGTLLAPGGLLAFEVGAGQAEAVADICNAEGLGPIAFAADLAGVRRVVLSGGRSAGAARGSAKKALGKVGMSG